MEPTMTTARKTEILATFAAKAAEFKASIVPIVAAAERVSMTFSANAVRGFFLLCEGADADLAELREFMAEHAAPKFTHTQHVNADEDGPAADFYAIAAS